jgi:uncharacterized protein (TIGR02284 family)
MTDRPLNPFRRCVGNVEVNKMNINHGNVIRALRYLYQIVEASERGYAVAASSVKNRAIKVLFKSHAAKRAQYKEEIFAEMQRLGAKSRPGNSILGSIHRGRVAIFAAMTIGEQNIEKVVFKEVVLGEKVAHYTYKRTLRLNLPEETRSLLQHQYEDIRVLLDRAQLMRGRHGKQLVLRLYDTAESADKAIQSLKKSNYASETIKKVLLDPVEMVYSGDGMKVTETTLSGAVGGAVWGMVSGLLAAFSILLDPENFFNISDASPELMALIALLGLVAAGMFVGGGIGFFIGSGVKDQDKYLYADGLQHGQILVEIITDTARAPQAWRLLEQVNIEART